nr:DNA helicase [Tanacetum cinerariifolium]
DYANQNGDQPCEEECLDFMWHRISNTTVDDNVFNSGFAQEYASYFEESIERRKRNMGSITLGSDSMGQAADENLFNGGSIQEDIPILEENVAKRETPSTDVQIPRNGRNVSTRLSTGGLDVAPITMILGCYIIEGLILERQKTKEEMEKMIAKAILQHQQDIAIWLALQMKFERVQVPQTTCRTPAIRPRDQDDPHDDAHPKGEKSAKRQNTSKYETYVSGESSSGQEQGPSTSGNQEQADDYDFLTDSYASDDDEILTKQVSQDIMEEVSLNVVEAKLKKITDEMLRLRCTSGDEHQYHIDQMKNFLKSDIVWEVKGNSRPEKIVLSLHKFPAVVFNDDDIEERTSRWVNKYVKKFNPYARYGVEHWKNPNAKIFYIRKQKEPGKPKEIIARRANDCIVSITEPDFKNLNKNDIEDMYLLIMNEKERVNDFQLGIKSYQQKVNLTAPTISFLEVKKHEMFSIIYEPVYEIIYKNSKKEKKVIGHSKIHKFCDATLNKVLEGLKSYNNDVRYGYNQRDLTKDEVEYLKLFEEEIEDQLKYRRQMRRWGSYVNGRPLGNEENAQNNRPFGEIVRMRNFRGQDEDTLNPEIVEGFYPDLVLKPSDGRGKVFSTIKQSRLDWVRNHQNDLCSDYLLGPDRIIAKVNMSIGDASTSMGEKHIQVDEIQNYSRTSCTNSECPFRNAQLVTFRERDRLDINVNMPEKKKTTLTEWYIYNNENTNGRHLTYLDFPSEFVWYPNLKTWHRRVVRTKKSHGRLTYVHSNSVELFYFWMLLCHQKGCNSLTKVRTVNGYVLPNYRDACEALGFLGDDKEWDIALEKPTVSASSTKLRTLFAQILIYYDESDPLKLWTKYWIIMKDDIPAKV